MILVDTSVWVDHLRKKEQGLVNVLEAKQVAMHSLIVGELACGNLANRTERLRDWRALPFIDELSNGEVLALIEAHKLMGRGIGLVDVHILGAVLNMEKMQLWTRDKRLHGIANDLGIAFAEENNG